MNDAKLVENELSRLVGKRLEKVEIATDIHAELIPKLDDTKAYLKFRPLNPIDGYDYDNYLHYFPNLLLNFGKEPNFDYRLGILGVWRISKAGKIIGEYVGSLDGNEQLRPNLEIILNKTVKLVAFLHDKHNLLIEFDNQVRLILGQSHEQILRLQLRMGNSSWFIWDGIIEYEFGTI
jgi:hypothetical protein